MNVRPHPANGHLWVVGIGGCGGATGRKVNLCLGNNNIYINNIGDEEPHCNTNINNNTINNCTCGTISRVLVLLIEYLWYYY